MIGDNQPQLDHPKGALVNLGLIPWEVPFEMTSGGIFCLLQDLIILIIIYIYTPYEINKSSLLTVYC